MVCVDSGDVVYSNAWCAEYYMIGMYREMPYCLNTLTFFVSYLKYDQQLQIKYCIKCVCKEQKMLNLRMKWADCTHVTTYVCTQALIHMYPTI